MATCIVSRAMQLDGAGALSGILLADGIAAYLVLAAVYAGRAAGWAVPAARGSCGRSPPVGRGRPHLAATTLAGGPGRGRGGLLGSGRDRIPAHRGPGDGRAAGLHGPPRRADARVLGLHGRL